MEANDIVLFDFDAFISGSKDVDYQEAIKKMSLSLMKFLIENDLLVNINPFNQDGSVKNDLIIKKSNLTDEGFQLFVKPVNNWWNALDRGTPPEKITILENGLKKIRAAKKWDFIFSDGLNIPWGRLKHPFFNNPIPVIPADTL